MGWTGRLGLVDENLHLEWIGNEVLLYSTGNYIQSLGIECDGKYYEKKECIYMYMCMLGHYAVQQKLTEHCKSTMIKKILSHSTMLNERPNSCSILYKHMSNNMNLINVK